MEDDIDKLIYKIYNPDFEIKLYYPDNKITKDIRLLSNVAKLGSQIVFEEMKEPYIRVKDTENGKNLVDYFFKVNWSEPITNNSDVDYFLDFIYCKDNKYCMYSCLYKNTPTPILFFDTLFFEYPISKMGLNALKNTKNFILEKYKHYFKQSNNGISLVHNIELKSQNWDIKVI